MTTDTQSKLKTMLGSRILREANDLKRTVSALAQEINVDEDKLKKIVAGDCDISEIYDVIERMGKTYPIDRSELYFTEDDCINGVRLMRASESEESSRVFSRADKNGERTPYYDYRDTAMSKGGSFKPEWIKELRVVDNADPENPDVAYNNGHFLHQLTFFIGPVNFYWEVNGKKFCQEMDTGDSNYITPFWPHSFTSRDPNQTALILAVTFGGDVQRAQKELYNLGASRLRDYALDAPNYNRATTQLIVQHMANENMTRENLKNIIEDKGINLDVERMLDEQADKPQQDLEALAECLNIELSDLLLSKSVKGNEVLTKKKSETQSYFYPNSGNKLYEIFPLVRCSKMPSTKGFNIEVMGNKASLDDPFVSSLNSYVYNYGDGPATFKWIKDGNTYEETVQPGDSLYIQPFIRHAFAKAGEGSVRLCVVRVSSAINLSTQKELSYFADVDRIIESKCWFD